MKQSSLARFLFAVVAMTTATSFAADQVVDLPEAAIKVYLEKHQIPSIKPRPNAPLNHDYEATWQAWFKYAVTEPFMARLTVEASVRDRAEQVVMEGILQIRKSPLRDISYTPEKMATACEALVKAGIDDPLIYWLQSWAVHESTRDFVASSKLFKRAYEHPKMKIVRPVLRQLMLVYFERTTRSVRVKSEFRQREKEIIEAVNLSLQDGTYLPEHDEILLINASVIFTSKSMFKEEQAVENICNLPMNSEWVRLMFRGHFHNRKAWKARGNGYANKVTAEGWRVFNEERNSAVDYFTNAWKMHPERYEATYQLLSMSMTGGSTSEGPFVWFDRVLDARFDNLQTYGAVLNGLRPRWGGSIEQMLAFGLACAQTRRFDTEVPYYFFRALADAVDDADESRSILHDPLISQVAMALCKQRVQDAPTHQLKEDAYALMGVYGWLCGNYKTAAEALEKVPGKFPRSVIIQLSSFAGWNEKTVRGESILFAGGHESDWVAAEKRLLDRDYETAEKLYESMRSQTKGPGIELASSKLAAIHFERELAKGDWTPLKIEPSLSSWQIQKGDWVGTPDGQLVNRGLGTSAFIYHLGRVGTEFQIRGEFESTATGLGVIVGYGHDAHEEHWITCVQNRKDAYVLHRYNTSSLEPVEIFEQGASSTFLITCHDGAITYAINGREIFREVVPHDTVEPGDVLTLMPDGKVGFCHYLFENGKETRIREVEVRLLPRNFALEAPHVSPPPADAVSLKVFESETPWAGEIKLGSGYYRTKQKIVLGLQDKDDAKKIAPAKVVSSSGTEIEAADIYIKKGEWTADGTLFRRTKLTMELGGKFEARNSLFDHCELHKGGNYFVKFFSTKWIFENCVFSKTFINPWKLVDIGVQAGNCTFYDVDFSSIKFKDDAGKEALDEWVTLNNCRFIRCKIPESVLFASRECVFEDCLFGDTEPDLPMKTPIKLKIYTKGNQNAPAVGQDRSLELLDVTNVSHPAGATLPHRSRSTGLSFE